MYFIRPGVTNNMILQDLMHLNAHRIVVLYVVNIMKVKKLVIIH